MRGKQRRVAWHGFEGLVGEIDGLWPGIQIGRVAKPNGPSAGLLEEDTPVPWITIRRKIIQKPNLWNI